MATNSGRVADGEQALVSDQAASRLAPSGFDPSRVIPLPPRFLGKDTPHWVRNWRPKDYASFRNLQLDQYRDQMTRSYRGGGNAIDWIDEAAGYLRTIGENSPEQGSLHHTLIIIAEQLCKITDQIRADAPAQSGQE